MPRLKQTVGLRPQTASRHRRSVMNREMWDGWSQGLRADLKRYRPKNGTARHRWATAIDPAVCGWMDVRFLLLMGCSGVHRKKKGFCRWMAGCSLVSHSQLTDESQGESQCHPFVVQHLLHTLWSQAARLGKSSSAEIVCCCQGGIEC